MPGTSIDYQPSIGVAGRRSNPQPRDQVDPILLDGTYTPTAYGVPVKLNSGKAAALQSGDAASLTIGILTWPQVDNLPSVLNQALGTTTPNPSVMHGLLRKGEINVAVANGTVARGGTPYIRVRDNGSTSRAIGSWEAAQGTTQATASTIKGLSGGAGTGNGTITMASPSASTTAQTGVWIVTCVEPAANGGTFNVISPTGILEGSAVVGTAYTGSIKFTIADGSTDFIAGDFFQVTCVSDCEALPNAEWVGPKDGSNIAQINLK